VIQQEDTQQIARTPGSTILTKWLADRQAARSQVQVNAQSCSSSNPSEFNDLFLSGISNAGPSVTENTVKQLAVVNACIGLIGGAIASMPLHSYEYTDDDERTRVRDDLSYMLNESPMPNWVASAFWEYVMQSKLLHGDAFCRIHRASRMSTTIVGFEPINPQKVFEIKKDGLILIYTYADDDGRFVTVDQGDMLHFPSIGFDGKRSPSTLRYGLRNAAGTALAADEYSARFFSNGARPDYFLTTDSPIKPESISQIRDELQRKYGGVSKSHLPGVLSGGLKVEQITMPHEDAQLLATRGFQIEEIARAFNVPPFLIGHNEKTTSFGKGIEEMGRMFVQYTLLRHLNPIRQETTRKIYPRKSGMFLEHNTAALERGDLKTRFEAYRVAIGRAGEPGWMTVNEARKLENWKAKDGGDELTNYGAINDGNTAA
jgi:HK97 family phage portal protein